MFCNIFSEITNIMIYEYFAEINFLSPLRKFFVRVV